MSDRATVIRAVTEYTGAQGPRCGVSHVPVNASAIESLVAIIARTDPNEQESVVLQPELEARVP